MTRKSFDKQFKLAAVKLVIEDNMTIAEVSKERLFITIPYTVG